MPMTPIKAGGLKRAKPLALPDSVAWMERLSMDMNTAANKKFNLVKRNNTLYELQLRYISSRGRLIFWTVSRTFDQYRALQRRLVKTIKPGHKCNAECKWLVNVVKNHFPKASLFRKNCPRTVESRRLSLLRLMTTVKTSLVNHGNVGCAIFRDQVSKEFAAFLVGDCKDEALHQHKYTASASVASIPFSGSPLHEVAEGDITSSIVSFTSDEEDPVLNYAFNYDFAVFECSLCGLSLDVADEITCKSLYYTATTFECGHQFHDMCVLPRLDEVVKCPLCQ